MGDSVLVLLVLVAVQTASRLENIHVRASSG